MTKFKRSYKGQDLSGVTVYSLDGLKSGSLIRWLDVDKAYIIWDDEQPIGHDGNGEYMVIHVEECELV